MKTHYLLAATVLTIACAKGDTTIADKTDTARSEAASNAAQVGDICSIASDAELAEAVGAPITAKEKSGGNGCIFKTAAPLVYADVHVDRDGAPSWEGVNAGNAKIGAAQDSLAGVGDSAFYGPRDRLYLMKSGAFISVEAGFDDSVRVRGKRVAQLIASKL